MANPFYVQPALATQSAMQGIGQLAQAGGQYFANSRSQDQNIQNTQQFMTLVGQAEASQNPEERKSLMIQAFTQFPEQAKQLRQQSAYAMEQQQLEQAGKPEAITPYQQKKFSIEDEKIRLRELELKAQQAGTDLERKKLENQVKLQSQKIAKNEREELAASKGPTAQNILKDSTEGQKKASSFAFRMVESNDELSNLESTIDPTARIIPMIASAGGVVSEAANRLASPEEQQYASAASDFVTAQLRKESGAAIGDAEFERKYREFFPVPGDTKKQIESKRKRRERANRSMIAESGSVYGALYKDAPVEAEKTVKASPDGAQYTEGMTATNPQTGEKVQYRGGKWLPM